MLNGFTDADWAGCRDTGTALKRLEETIGDESNRDDDDGKGAGDGDSEPAPV